MEVIAKLIPCYHFFGPLCVSDVVLCSVSLEVSVLPVSMFLQLLEDKQHSVRQIAVLSAASLYSLFNTHLTHTVFRKKHPLTFSFISRWKMFRFTQNFQGMFVSN